MNNINNILIELKVDEQSKVGDVHFPKVYGPNADQTSQVCLQ